MAAGRVSSSPGAYPLSRGEHSRPILATAYCAGLPPLARGTPILYLAEGHTIRLTPARAGNTASASPASPPAGAYPRSRGEHSCPSSVYRDWKGLPPLARGTRSSASGHDLDGGLTPARAGNTVGQATTTTATEAYPRSRGEHSPRTCPPRGRSGLPPLARGTRRLHPAPQEGRGLTPARAGNTPVCRRAGSRSGAYPRSRGEHDSNGGYQAVSDGLPPLARGTLAERVDAAA